MRSKVGMRAFLFSILVSLSVTGHAAGSWSGKVVELRASNVTNTILFSLSGELEKPASCNEWKMYAIDLRNPGGEQVFELVKYAYLNNLAIEASSLGTCRSHWKSEGVKEVLLRRTTP